jgi:hypothetical protein
LKPNPPKINKIVFVVIDIYTKIPIGVFDDYDIAKNSASILTKDKFIILRFNLNADCTYLIDNITKSK